MSIFKGLSSDFNVRSYVCTHKHLISYFSWYWWEWNEWASLSLGSVRAFYINLEDNERTVWTISNSSKQTNLKKPCILSIQSLSCVRLFVTPWTVACQASLSVTNSWSLLKLMSIESVIPPNHLILCHLLLLLPSVFSSIRVFSIESFSSVAQSCPTLCDPMNRSTPGHPVHHQHPESTQTHVRCVGDAIQPSHPLSSCLLLPSVFPSIRVFSNESALRIRWPKYWSFSFSISPSSEQPGLISFRIDWFDLLAVQETLKRLLQHHSSKASILWRSAFFMVQLILIHDSWKHHSFD